MLKSHTCHQHQRGRGCRTAGPGTCPGSGSLVPAPPLTALGRMACPPRLSASLTRVMAGAASRAVARIKQKRKCKLHAVMPRGQPALRGQKLPLVQERGLRWHGGCRGRRTPGKLSPWCRHHVTQFNTEQRLTFCFALKQNFGKTVLLLLSWRSYNWKEVCVCVCI